MNAHDSLQSLGLSAQETSIYIALLETGGQAASDLAKRLKLERTTAYAALKRLVAKGFASIYTRRHRQVFVPEKPQNLIGHFEERLRDFETVIPELETLEKKEVRSSGVRFIETVDELKRFYTSILREYKGKSYDIMGNSNVWEGLDTAYFKKFRVKRGQNRINTRLLVTADSLGVSPTDPRLLRDVRYLPEKYTFKSTMDIFDDKVLIIGSQQTSVAVVIAVPSMVDIFKSNSCAYTDFTADGDSGSNEKKRGRTKVTN